MPRLKNMDIKIEKLGIFSQIGLNTIVLTLVGISYKKDTLSPINMALNIATLRYHITPWIKPRPEDINH